ncbi:MAG: sirohydrochlorin ferrochelatase [Oleiphilaceae bacterium]|jgi:sirohydrochlorin ferrochelatase
MENGKVKALVVVAHGSRLAASNEEVGELACHLAGLVVEEFPIVGVGFLELAEPLIPESLEKVIEQGATEICVFPYFLSSGRHVVTDVPNEVKTVQEKYPDLQINILTYLGALPGLKNFIAKALC